METRLTSIKRTLAACPTFSLLNDAELEKVAILVVEREYAAGDTIFEQGQKAEDVFVIQEGKVVLQMSLSARRVTVDFAAKNELIGGSAVVEPYVNSLTAVCLQKTKALAISGVKFRALLRDNYHVGYVVLSGLIKVVVARLADTRQMLISERSLPAKLE